MCLSPWPSNQPSAAAAGTQGSILSSERWSEERATTPLPAASVRTVSVTCSFKRRERNMEFIECAGHRAFHKHLARAERLASAALSPHALMRCVIRSRARGAIRADAASKRNARRALPFIANTSPPRCNRARLRLMDKRIAWATCRPACPAASPTQCLCMRSAIQDFRSSQTLAPRHKASQNTGWG